MYQIDWWTIGGEEIDDTTQHLTRAPNRQLSEILRFADGRFSLCQWKMRFQAQSIQLHSVQERTAGRDVHVQATTTFFFFFSLADECGGAAG